MDYRGWMFDEKEPLPKAVQNALDNYIKHNGLPEQILIETGLEEVPVPEGMNLVTKVVSLPKNIILVGKIGE